MENRTIHTTLAIPADLIEATDCAVQQGLARSRNEFVALALRHELAAQKRAEIDAAFAAMADDDEYQSQALMISDEFAIAQLGSVSIRLPMRRGEVYDARLAPTEGSQADRDLTYNYC